jgi:hypothetical protein
VRAGSANILGGHRRALFGSRFAPGRLSELQAHMSNIADTHRHKLSAAAAGPIFSRQGGRARAQLINTVAEPTAKYIESSICVRCS